MSYHWFPIIFEIVQKLFSCPLWWEQNRNNCLFDTDVFTLQWFWGLNCNYCQGWRGFKLVVSLNAFMNAWCPKASCRWRNRSLSVPQGITEGLTLPREVSLFVQVIHCTCLRFHCTGFYFCQLPETSARLIHFEDLLILNVHCVLLYLFIYSMSSIISYCLSLHINV